MGRGAHCAKQGTEAQKYAAQPATPRSTTCEGTDHREAPSGAPGGLRDEGRWRGVHPGRLPQQDTAEAPTFVVGAFCGEVGPRDCRVLASYLRADWLLHPHIESKAIAGPGALTAARHAGKCGFDWQLSSLAANWVGGGSREE